MANFERRGPHDGHDRDQQVGDELALALRAIRPRPGRDFTTELDARAAAGFPARRGDHSPTAAGGGDRADRGADSETAGAPREPRSWRERLRLPGRLRPAPVMAGLAVACAIGAAVVVTDPAQLDTQGGDDAAIMLEPAQTEGGAGPTSSSSEGMNSFGDAASDMAVPEPGAAMDRATRSPTAGGPLAAQAQQRAVERGARLVLGTEPSELGRVASEVLRVTDSHNGIVLSSLTREGEAGSSGAMFSLMVPSAQLGPTLADLSELATVRVREESSADITAPTVSTTDRLREARAEVNGLLKQLAEATTDSERETIRIELAPAQQRVAGLRSELNRLERRASFANLQVSVVTGGSDSASEDEGWSISDAAEDALDVLSVIAGIAIIALAFLLPAALLFAIFALARRVWIGRDRERALRDSGGPGGA